jgi:hypothetical protein
VRAEPGSFASALCDNFLPVREVHQRSSEVLRDIVRRCHEVVVNAVALTFRNRPKEDAKEAAANLCAIKLMSNELPWFKKPAFELVDQLLHFYQNAFSRINPIAINTLGTVLNLHADGATIVAEHLLFRALRLFNLFQTCVRKWQSKVFCRIRIV